MEKIEKNLQGEFLNFFNCSIEILAKITKIEKIKKLQGEFFNFSFFLKFFC